MEILRAERKRRHSYMKEVRGWSQQESITTIDYVLHFDKNVILQEKDAIFFKTCCFFVTPFFSQLSGVSGIQLSDASCEFAAGFFFTILD